ncbi:hypothetical protein GCM10007916_11750 [Psychromonas marina]|uniref:Permease n=1 Tax=Psychromonas marina TaxID=88364 RepID=A0ABQ6DY93_9GAMM|nr:hypothetical protein [Psychromonas marina]GLS90108.1 hypothetical protein GCM10007916_11750 [Psychromonas marina]
MLTGHYATALIPYELTRKEQRVGFWLFLLAAQFLDVLMLLLISVNIESFNPPNFFEASFSTITTNMFVSHDLIPVIGWAVLFGLVVWGITKKPVVALWCVGLIVFHELCDFIVGFEHFVFGTDTAPIGFALYSNAPVAGMLLEAVMCLAIVLWFTRKRANEGNPVSMMVKVGLYVILVGGALSTIPVATQSLNSLFGLSI